MRFRPKVLAVLAILLAVLGTVVWVLVSTWLDGKGLISGRALFAAAAATLGGLAALMPVLSSLDKGTDHSARLREHRRERMRRMAEERDER